MSFINQTVIFEVLKETGSELASFGQSTPIELVVAGGSAGLLGGLFRAERSTGDCDVLWHLDDDAWLRVCEASRIVAQRRSLLPDWLNDRCRIFAWSLPLGWRDRCEPAASFPPLFVLRLSRFDLIASKIVSAPKRPHDLDDLLDLRPTPAELERADEHLDRLEAEDLDRQDYDAQRKILNALRKHK